MTAEALGGLFREGMTLLLVVGGPLFGVMLVVGLVLGIVQSATQIQEPAVGAVPRLGSVVLVAVFLGPWMVQRLAQFLHAALERMAERGL